ncbi:hypothetical protein HK102_008241 [Quaeritorhiza haematococci]|nr:hypothetical protein HK102_008241 [Quaeritorhiza haematococci]
MDEMNKAIADGDGKKASSVASDLVSAAKQYLSIAKKEAENTSDAAFKMELEAKILEVERVIPDLLSKAKYFAETQALGGIFSDEDQNALRDIVKNITSKMSDLGHIICKNRGIELPNTQAPPPLPVEELKPVVEEKKPEPVEAAKEEVAPVVVEKAPEPVVELPDDVVVVEEEAPKPLSAEEAKENPIKAAAQELKVEVSQWASSENPIVEAASLISKYLDALSRHHKALLTNPTPEAKRDFIRAAQDIMAQGLAIVEPVKKLAESCTDLRLRRQLLGTIDRVTTLAQQLKIVAAVKASAPRDTDRDHVLIACAQNLMQAVKTCLRESEAASLRTGPQPVRSQDKTKGSTPVKSDVAAKVAPFKFKRQVFKGVAVPGRMTQVN